MCGIVGILSTNNDINEQLLNGLNELQNRGYDSMGISLITPDNKYFIKKEISINNSCDSIIDKLRTNTYSTNGIAHSRWATHGRITKSNAHPHQCYKEIFCLVHNGIIENYLELKQDLLQQNIEFKSDTDSEVIVNLISFTFDILKNTYPKEDIYNLICKAITTVCTNLEGTFGLVIQCILTPTKLFCIRYGSPLIIGLSESVVMVVSEKSAFSPAITHYTALKNHDLIVLQPDSKKFISIHNSNAYTLNFLNMSFENNENPYDSWTEKEIIEQPYAIHRCINFGSRIKSDFTTSLLGGLTSVSEKILNTEHLVLMGCGTSYHACLLVASYYRKIKTLNTVQVFDASEFDPILLPKNGTISVIVVSQSGETIDLAISIQKIRKHNPDILILGVVNVVDSLIANEVDAGVYTNCGKERGVASTKSFMTQVIVLILISFHFSNQSSYSKVLQDLSQFPISLNNNMNIYFQKVSDLIPLIHKFKNIFIIGRSSDYYISMEASLKIKEISYIHSEAYSSSSLKHGPFALLDKDMLVILVSSIPEERKKCENAYQEIYSRKSPLLVISYENMFNCPMFIQIPLHSVCFLEAICVLQIIALNLCNSLGHNPDYPRNLAKVVTVE